MQLRWKKNRFCSYPHLIIKFTIVSGSINDYPIQSAWILCGTTRLKLLKTLSLVINGVWVACLIICEVVKAIKRSRGAIKASERWSSPKTKTFASTVRPLLHRHVAQQSLKFTSFANKDRNFVEKAVCKDNSDENKIPYRF